MGIENLETETPEEIGVDYKSRTITKNTPCGNIYIHICFTEDKISQVLITPCRSTDCEGSWAYAVADLLTALCRRLRMSYEGDRELILKALKNHRCGKTFVGMPYSCADAISRALTEVLNEKKTVNLPKV